MKTIKLIGAMRSIALIALAAVIVFSMIACGGDDDVTVTGVTLDQSTLALTVGGTAELTATVVPADATNKALTWSSSDAAVATVSGGTVTGVSVGTATITVTTADGGKTATCAVTVTPSPESLPPAERWNSWADPSSTATITHLVDVDDECEITVGGTALDSGDLRNSIWKAVAGYKYTAVANKNYTFKFEAWTDTGTRKMQIQWYGDSSTNTYFGTDWNNPQTPHFSIDTTRKIYTITTERIPKSGVQNLEFHCANQTGTFYVKIVSVNEYYDHGTPNQNWISWVSSESTANLTYSVDADGVCTIAVGRGEVVSTNARWKANVRYMHDAAKDTVYEYKFEAWEETDQWNQDRTIVIQYYNGLVGGALSADPITINTTRTTYTIIGDAIPKNDDRGIEFLCGDKPGKFYVKLLSITPLVRKTIFNMQDSAAGTITHNIQGLTVDGTTNLGLPANRDSLAPLAEATADGAAATIIAVNNNGKIALKFTTSADWGPGIDLPDAAFDFHKGDTIKITGELITGNGGVALVNINVGSSFLLPYTDCIMTTEGIFTWNIDLVAGMLPHIKEGNPAGIRLEGGRYGSGGTVIRIDNIVIEGYR